MRKISERNFLNRNLDEKKDVSASQRRWLDEKKIH